jgi:hypothetical protein
MEGGTLFGNNNWEQKISPSLRTCFYNKPGDCGQIIIELVGQERRQVTSIISRKNGHIKHDVALMPSIVVEISFAALPELAQSKQVKKIWTDSEVKIL